MFDTFSIFHVDGHLPPLLFCYIHLVILCPLAHTAQPASYSISVARFAADTQAFLLLLSLNLACTFDSVVTLCLAVPKSSLGMKLSACSSIKCADIASPCVVLQYAHSKAPGGVDPLFLFRAQRMLQRKDINLWTRTTQTEMSGQKLEIAFDTLYPGRVRKTNNYSSLLCCVQLVLRSRHACILHSMTAASNCWLYMENLSWDHLEQDRVLYCIKS